MNDKTCVVCRYDKHYTHFPLQDFDQMIIPICSPCLATAKPNPGWRQDVEAAIAKAREILVWHGSRYDFTKRA